MRRRSGQARARPPGPGRRVTKAADSPILLGIRELPTPAGGCTPSRGVRTLPLWQCRALPVLLLDSNIDAPC